MRSAFVLSAALALGQQALAVSVYGQCGGISYSGDTACDAGSTCTRQNGS
jgi:endoglucanase